MFCNARSASVQTYEGNLDNLSLARQYPSDYNAAIGVQDRIQRWGRYIVLDPPDQIDLVFVVWKERDTGNRLPGQPTEMPPAAGGPREPGGPGQNPGQNPGQSTWPGQGPGIGNGSGSAGSGQRGGFEVGGMWPVDDQLAVYMPLGDGTMGTPLWRESQKDGLKEPKMPLFSKLADAVDDACSDQK